MPWSKQVRNEDEVATAAVIYLGGGFPGARHSDA
jgi:hypothetical protein